MDDERSDEELLAAHVAGDAPAFGVLFDRHRDRMWAVALRTTRDQQEAADAVQDAALNAFRHADTFRGDSSVTTWLHRIVVNACLDRARRRAARPVEVLPDEDLFAALDGRLNRDAGRRDRADEASRRQAQLDVRAALGTLTREQQAALTLVDMAGYSVDEAAELLECAPGTVKSRCARGRARLALALAEWGPDDGNPSAAAGVEANTSKGAGGGP